MNRFLSVRDGIAYAHIPGCLDPREMGVWSIPPVYIHRVWDEEFRLLHKSFMYGSPKLTI